MVVISNRQWKTAEAWSGSDSNRSSKLDTHGRSIYRGQGHNYHPVTGTTGSGTTKTATTQHHHGEMGTRRVNLGCGIMETTYSTYPQHAVHVGGGKFWNVKQHHCPLEDIRRHTTQLLGQKAAQPALESNKLCAHSTHEHEDAHPD